MTTLEMEPRSLPVEKTMDAAEYNALCKQLDLASTRMLASKLGVSLASAQRYESGRQEIPEPVARLLRMYVKHGIPRGW